MSQTDDAAEHGGADPALLQEIREGLSRPDPELPARFFYDERGSELFERITELPEYYLTRAERALLERCMPEWIGALRPAAMLELGAGSAAKTRLVLDQIVANHPEPLYVPVDVSEEFVRAAARRLDHAYPALQVRTAIADIAGAFKLPTDLPRPVLVAFLGSTIGNFAPDAAVRLLGAVRDALAPGDRLLLGVDLRKDVAVIEAAYNDAAGVTAEFNRNMLHVLNREARADFHPGAWEHRAFYDRARDRIEMHLVAGSPQRVTVPGAGEWSFAAGDTIRTEISCKHDHASIAGLFVQAGLRIDRWQVFEPTPYALVLGAPSP